MARAAKTERERTGRTQVRMGNQEAISRLLWGGARRKGRSVLAKGSRKQNANGSNVQKSLGLESNASGEMLLVNVSRHFVKGKPKNALTDEGIAAVAEAFQAWETRAKLSRVVTLAEVRAADRKLSPSQFVEVGERMTHRAIADLLADLDVARIEREQADARLAEVLSRLGLTARGAKV